jgi:hypothetical protein
MRTPLAKPLLFAFIAGAALLAVYALASWTPPVSLTIRGFTTNQLADGSGVYVCALVELSNATRRPITYLAHPDNRTLAAYLILHATAQGWSEPEHAYTSVTRFALLPSEVVTFHAVVESDKPCKVALDYWHDRKASRLWQSLPRSLRQRLPWCRTLGTVTTDAIDLRSNRI